MPVSPHLETDVAKVLAFVEALGRDAVRPYDAEGAILVLLAGLPGSGKSSFARRLKPLIGAVVLQSDELRRLLFESPRHGDEESKRLFRAVQAATQRLLQDGRSVVIDATNLRETYRQPFYAIAMRTGARLHVVHVVAPQQVVLDRLARRRDALDPDEASQAYEGVYALLQQQEEAPRVPHLRVDTSDPLSVDAALRTLLGEGSTVGIATGRPNIGPRGVAIMTRALEDPVE